MLQNSESFLIKLNLFKSFEFQQQKLPHETGAFRVASRIIREAAWTQSLFTSQWKQVAKL